MASGTGAPQRDGVCLGDCYVTQEPTSSLRFLPDLERGGVIQSDQWPSVDDEIRNRGAENGGGSYGSEVPPMGEDCWAWTKQGGGGGGDPKKQRGRGRKMVEKYGESSSTEDRQTEVERYHSLR